jgi:hypothetical protein
MQQAIRNQSGKHNIGAIWLWALQTGFLSTEFKAKKIMRYKKNDFGEWRITSVLSLIHFSEQPQEN